MIIRGTTPNMTFKLPFNADMLDTGYVVIQQNKQTVIEKKLIECECGETTVTAKLTQEETLKLTTKVNAVINIVVKTLGGERVESLPIYERVEETSKNEVI